MRDLFRRNGGRSRLTWRRLAVLLEALPGDGCYKTAVRDDIDDETLAELAQQPRKGHGRLSRTDLLLLDLIDLTGILCYAMRAFDKPPEPRARPGIVKRGRRKADPATLATIRAIAEEHARLHGYDLPS